MRTLAFNQFDGGMTSDPRNPAENACRVSKHFDNFTYPHKLSPYRSSESGDSAAATSQKQNFGIGYTGSVYKLYSLGVKSGAGTAEILMKLLSTGGSGDLGDAAWSTPSNNQAASGATNFNLFIFYKMTGLFYGASGGTTIWTFDPTGVAAFSASSHSLTYTNIAQGLVHSKDDILYVPYDNKIASNNAGSWTDAAITLPTSLYITSICEYGNYLAIACAPLSGFGKSRVYLWDRNSSLTTLSETIDWGEGILQVLEEIEGYLVGISIKSTNAFPERWVFKYYNSTVGAIKFQELIASSVSNALLLAKQKLENRIYFMGTIIINGVTHEGVWTIGRNSISRPFAITLDRKPNNDTATTNGGMRNFFVVGDFMFQSYVDNGNYGLSKTDDVANYTATSIYETTINPEQPERYRASAGIRSVKKQILAALIATEALPSGAQVVVKYKVDGGSWTNYLTHSGTGQVATEMSAIGDTGREFEFQFNSTGGAEITEFKYKLEPNESLL